MTDDARRLLDLLWTRHAAEVPPARAAAELLGGKPAIDHVAFRTLRREDGHGGIALLAPVFERLGWRRAGTYAFPDAGLDAVHLSHPQGLPRVFLSELVPSELSETARRILARLPPDPAPPERVELLAEWFGPPRATVSERELLVLAAASQYAAWLVAFGRKPNHFTARVDDVEAWSARLRAAGIAMKEEIEGERASPLRQTATRPSRLAVPLEGGGTREWPYAYFELAQRREGFDGFLAPQSRPLFDLTRPD